MSKSILKIAVIFAAGIIGGIFADQVLTPHFFKEPLSSQPVYVTQIKEVIIKENDALESALEKAGKALVAIKSVAQDGKILTGSGLVITSDGFVLTLNELVPQGSTFYFYVNGKIQSFQILKRDSEANLALIKLGENNLSTAGFADPEQIKLGQEFFLAGFIFQNGTPQMAVNEGVIRSIGPGATQTTISEKNDMKGSVLFDVEGNVLGIGDVDQDGQVVCITAEKIKEFSGL